MPATRHRPDDQSDYEDPIDRYRPRDDTPRPKRKPKNPNANASFTVGLVSLVPVLGCFLGPLAILLALTGFSYARANPDAGGRGRAKSGMWFGLVGCLISYGVPAIIYGLSFLLTRF
jgi:hypothetical protein